MLCCLNGRASVPAAEVLGVLLLLLLGQLPAMIAALVLQIQQRRQWGQQCSIVEALSEDVVRLLIELDRAGGPLSILQNGSGLLQGYAKLLQENPRLCAELDKVYPERHLWGPIAAGGAGSAQQRQQLLGLCCSLLKLCNGAARLRSLPVRGEGSALLLRDLLLPAVCFTAAEVLKAADEAGKRQGSAGRQGTNTAAAAAAAAASGNSGASGSGSADAVELLPWAVIIGRCFLIWGVELLMLHKAGYSATGSSGTESIICGAPTAMAARQRCAVLYAPINELAMSAHFAIQSVFQEDKSNAEQLFTAGYTSTLQPAVQQAGCFMMMALCKGRQCTDNPEKADPAIGEGVLEAAEELGAVGMMLSSLAAPCLCNNPGCSNVSGPTESEMVHAGSCRCSACRTARYCSKECQKEHWKQHKTACKVLAATAAGKGAEVQQAAAEQAMRESIAASLDDSHPWLRGAPWLQRQQP